MISNNHLSVLSASAERTYKQADEFAFVQRDMNGDQNNKSMPFHFYFDNGQFAWFGMLRENFPITRRLVTLDANTTAMQYTVYSAMSPEPGNYGPAEHAHEAFHFWMIDGYIRFGVVDNTNGAIAINQRNLLAHLGNCIANALVDVHFQPAPGTPIEPVQQTA